VPAVAQSIMAQHESAKTSTERAEQAWDERQDKIRSWAAEHGVEVDFHYGNVVVNPDDFERLLIKAAEGAHA
jgi:hypothetical protein